MSVEYIQRLVKEGERGSSCAGTFDNASTGQNSRPGDTDGCEMAEKRQRQDSAAFQKN
jgi:hypothetical protein